MIFQDSPNNRRSGWREWYISPGLACAVGLTCLALSAFGWTRDRADFYAGWLAAVTVLAAWPLGSIALLLIHGITGGAWGNALRPALRVGVFSLPLLFAAFLPLILGVHGLYPWARPVVHARLHNVFYLNLPFLAWRVLIYCVCWTILGVLALRPEHCLAPAGLFVLAVTVSFASIDSTMSLDPYFVSSIYGMLTGAGMVLMALSLAVMGTVGGAAPDRRGDLGKLLLALVVLWIYLDFMQLLIIWQSDLAHEAPWYDQRSRGAWGALRAIIALGHFVLPFALLLSPRLRRAPRAVGAIAALLVVMEILRAWWTVLPASGHFISWIDIACMAGLFGLALGVAPLVARLTLLWPARSG